MKGDFTMARKSKPRAYIKKVFCGHWMFEPVSEWRAYNDWGNYVASGKTRKECEKECRLYGYVPEIDRAWR